MLGSCGVSDARYAVGDKVDVDDVIVAADPSSTGIPYKEIKYIEITKYIQIRKEVRRKKERKK